MDTDTKAQALRKEASMLTDLADDAERRSAVWREHAAANLAKAILLDGGDPQVTDQGAEARKGGGS